MENKRSRYDFWLLLFAVASLGAFLFRAPDAAAGFSRGLSLAFLRVLPSLFPFMVVSSFLLSSGLSEVLAPFLSPLVLPLKVSGGSLCYLAALCSGNPLGAKTVCESYARGDICRRDAQVLLALCSNAGAAFVYGAIGLSGFKSNAAALVLLAVNYAAPYLTAFLLSLFLPAERKKASGAVSSRNQKGYAACFVEAVVQSARAALNIAAFIGFFSVVSAVLESVLPRFAGTALMAVFSALLELGGGVTAIFECQALSFELSIVLCAAAIGFGGVCLYFQCLCFIAETDLSARVFLLGKLCGGLLAAGMCAISLKLFRINALTASAPIEKSASLDLRGSLVLLGLFLLVIALGFVKARLKSRGRGK